MQPHLLPILHETLHRTEKSDNTLNNATQMPHSMAQIFTTANFGLTLTCFLFVSVCICHTLTVYLFLSLSVSLSVSVSLSHTHMHHSQHVNSCGICVIPPPLPCPTQLTAWWRYWGICIVLAEPVSPRPPPPPPTHAHTTHSLMKILGYLHSLAEASLISPPPPPTNTCTHNSQLDEDTGVSV